MAIDFQFNLSGVDKTLKFLEELGDAPESEELWDVIGRSEMNLVRDHLYEKDAKGNKLGGERTHYYRGAGDSADVEARPGQATVTVGQVGLRLRWKGGVVRMKDKLLTIPTDPRAHGKRAGEFDDLVYVPRNRGATRGLLLQEDRVLYVLRTETSHAPDASVMPSEDEFVKTAVEATEDWLSEEFGGEI